MTDTSLPNTQSSVDPQSYVDSYAPPATSAPTASSMSSTTATPPTSSAPQRDHDPLEELEKALKEYEERQKQLGEQKQEAVEKTQAVVEASPKEDPLKELERVLDEYEAKFKSDDQALAPAVSAPAQQDALSQEEYRSVLKDEPVSTPAPAESAASSTSSAPATGPAEKIEEQNIFELLGVMDADSSEKEAFLDELQTALWEDFLDKDLALLVTESQLKEVRDLRAQTSLPENDRQEKLIKKVESLVPDIEDIMLEKALELKEEMVKERMAGMKEYFAAQSDKLAKIQEAETHISAGQWKTGAQLLNSLTA